MLTSSLFAFTSSLLFWFDDAGKENAVRGVDVEPTLDATSDSGSDEEDGVQALWRERFLERSY